MSTQAGHGWWGRRTARREASPRAEREPVVGEASPRAEPEPVVGEASPRAEREPVVGEASPRAEPEPVVALDAASVDTAAGAQRLVDLSLIVWPGTARMVLGAPGSGKRLLFDLISGMVPPTSGRVVLFGRETSGWTRQDRTAAARRIGRVFDDDRLLDHLSVFDNVALPLRSAGIGGREVRHRVNDLLAWIGLGKAAAATPPALTPEQRRLMAIARAVVSRPPLILAESPLRDLSTASATAVVFLLEEMARHGTAVLVAGEAAREAGGEARGDAIRFPAPALRLRGGQLAEDRPTAVRAAGLAGAEP